VNHQIIDDRRTTLSTAALAALRENLHEQRLFLQEQLEQLSAAATAHADAPRTASALEIRVKLTASARMVLADVEAALERMDRGDYGSCRLCRGPIAHDRLVIVPQARYCGRCQQVKEAGR
jgi:DnaK suppressor protein